MKIIAVFLIVVGCVFGEQEVSETFHSKGHDSGRQYTAVIQENKHASGDQSSDGVHSDYARHGVVESHPPAVVSVPTNVNSPIPVAIHVQAHHQGAEGRQGHTGGYQGKIGQIPHQWEQKIGQTPGQWGQISWDPSGYAWNQEAGKEQIFHQGIYQNENIAPRHQVIGSQPGQSYGGQGQTGQSYGIYAQPVAIYAIPEVKYRAGAQDIEHRSPQGHHQGHQGQGQGHKSIISTFPYAIVSDGGDVSGKIQIFPTGQIRIPQRPSGQYVQQKSQHQSQSQGQSQGQGISQLAQIVPIDQLYHVKVADEQEQPAQIHTFSVGQHSVSLKQQPHLKTVGISSPIGQIFGSGGVYAAPPPSAYIFNGIKTQQINPIKPANVHTSIIPTFPFVSVRVEDGVNQGHQQQIQGQPQQ